MQHPCRNFSDMKPFHWINSAQIAKSLQACIAVGIALELTCGVENVVFLLTCMHHFKWSDLLTQELIMDLAHYPDDCPSIPSNKENKMMQINFSHPSGSTVHSGSQSTLTIVASTRIFKRSIWWCHCIKSLKWFVQLLLRAKLFPASFKNPKTAFMFDVLDQFQLDALECKTVAMNFMSKIRRITDEVFPSLVLIGPLTN
jgi:hypothetical protein